MRRNASIELLRCLSIFGVCWLHALEQGGYAAAHRGLDNLLMSSVVVFVFISGWFGIRLGGGRIFRLLAISIYCAAVPVVLFDCLYLGHRDLSFLLGRFWQYFIEPWFLWTYLGLVLVAPAFDPLFKESKRYIIVKVLPVVFLAFFWGYAATKIPILKIYTPHIEGFGAFGLLSFIGIYLTARACRVLEVDKMLKIRHLLCMALVSAPICWLGCGHYHSPAALILAATIFFAFTKMSILSANLQAVILWLSTSTFSIYLLHRQSMGMTWMQYIEDEFIGARGCNYYVVCFLVAIGFFIGALTLDMPRRFICSVVKRHREHIS